MTFRDFSEAISFTTVNKNLSKIVKLLCLAFTKIKKVKTYNEVFTF
jgi:hypothetical protein